MMTIELKNIEQLSDAARQFLPLITKPCVIAFYGGMGAGKTTFIKALCQEMGVQDVVTSPTFALINEYKRPNNQSIFHFDFYRINRLEEAYDFGYEDYFYGSNLCLVEWPEKIEQLIPHDALKVRIAVNTDNSRTITIL